MPQAIPHQGAIATIVHEKSKQGLSMSAIYRLVRAKGLQYCPQSEPTFRKLYRGDWERAHSETVAAVGEMIIQKALEEKDYKAAELYLTTHSPEWMKKSAEFHLNQNVDEEEDTETPVNILMDALGFGRDDPEETPDGTTERES